MARRTLAQAETNYHISQCSYWNQKNLELIKIDTPITVCGDMSSIITYCTGIVQMTYESIYSVHLNPFPVWYAGREDICRGKSVWVQQVSISQSMMNWVSQRLWELICICETVDSCMLTPCGYFMLMMFLAALRFSADTIMYLHQLSKCCWHSHRCKLIHFRLHNCHNCQYDCSGPQILLMMQDEKLFTLNFRMQQGACLSLFWLLRQPMKQIKRMMCQS